MPNILKVDKQIKRDISLKFYFEICKFRVHSVENWEIYSLKNISWNQIIRNVLIKNIGFKKFVQNLWIYSHHFWKKLREIRVSTSKFHCKAFSRNITFNSDSKFLDFSHCAPKIASFKVKCPTLNYFNLLI